MKSLTRSHRFALTVYLAVAAVMVGGGTAFAQDDTVPVPGADPAPFIIVAPVVMTAISTLIPILNGLLTRITLHSGVKAVLTLVLNAVAALLVTATQADGTAVISNAAFLTFVYGTIVSIASYVGLWRPLDVTSSTPSGKLAPQSGIGPTGG